MDKVCIDACVIGTEKHLIVSDDGFVWSHHVPDDAWHLTGELKLSSTRCLDTLLRLEHVDIDLKPSRSWREVVDTVSKAEPLVHVPWQLVMPSRDHRAFIKRLVDEVQGILPSVIANYYRDTWVKHTRVFNSLQRARIDTQRWRVAQASNVKNTAAIESFRPLSDGLAREVVYDRLNTHTGRLTVKSGPQILTLARTLRDIIAPREGYKLINFDFAALEARVLLYECGGKCTEPDLYASMAQSIFNGSVERDAVKIAVLSELYGSSKYELGIRLGVQGAELDKFVDAVKLFFNSHKLKKRIRAHYVKYGFIRNRYDRHVNVDDPLDHILVNYYVQSTGCDVALSGFCQILDKLEPQGGRLLYLLHDAAIFEVPTHVAEKLERIAWLKIPGYVQKFAIKAGAFN